MRHVFETQSYLPMAGDASGKVVLEFRQRYGEIDWILDQNPEVIRLAHQDLKKLSTGGRYGRKGAYTSENIVRALFVHQIEQTPWRGTVVLISEMPFLRDFVRLGPGPVMDFTFLDKCFKAIRPSTWARIHEVLRGHAVELGMVEPERIRVDSTVIEANIHYPTDESLLWDTWRVTTRLLRAVRDAYKWLVPHRFHNRKAKVDYLFLARYTSSTSKKRQREVRRRRGRLLAQVKRVVGIAEEVCESPVQQYDLEVEAIVGELAGYLPAMRHVLFVAERAWVNREVVAASERVFSIFEPHVELIKRGKAHKPVEFGHAVWLSQTRDKFIVDFEVMEEKTPDEKLLPRIVERHREAFGSYPEGVAGDGGFRSTCESMAEIGEKVKHVAVAKRRWEEPAAALGWWQRFRAGVEGTISTLKRAYRLSLCHYRGFKSFAASIGMAIVCHNLVRMAAHLGV